jgi:hypothetical protein
MMSPRWNLLHRLQSAACAYFLHESDPVTGLVRDKTEPTWPASIAATGLALTVYPVAVERGFMSRYAAIERTLTTLRFFWNSAQGPEPEATGYRGLYYHFLDMRTGRRVWQSELSTVDSAFLFAGMLAAAQYFDDNSADQREIRRLAQGLYLRADWSWLHAEDGTIGHGWRPESGPIPHSWQGFDEALLLYTLALGSPTHPVPASAYAAWCSTYEWRTLYEIDHLYSPPLFTHQLSHVWIDFRGIQDAYMRGKGIDYFQNSGRATQIQQRYAQANPLGFVGYGENCWGITASDGPGPADRNIDGRLIHFHDYDGRGAPGGVDDGTLAPWAVVASLPFAPDIVLPAIEHFVDVLKLHDNHPYGFKATFNQTWGNAPDSQGRRLHGEIAGGGWVSPFHFGIDVGPIVLMIENYRSGMVWNLMRTCPFVIDGLKRAGFLGGWLEETSDIVGQS